jgi:hypothetical protein
MAGLQAFCHAASVIQLHDEGKLVGQLVFDGAALFGCSEPTVWTELSNRPVWPRDAPDFGVTCQKAGCGCLRSGRTIDGAAYTEALPMPVVGQRPTEADIEFMRCLEDEYRVVTGLHDRSQFKIFYGPVWRAPIMLLGINPGGDPKTIAPDGVHYLDGRSSRAASCIGYCENGENDLVDCTWHENTGLLKLLLPLLGSTEAIRRSVVKSNLAFVRLKNTKDRQSIERSKDQSVPFLRRILDRVRPDLILLTGVKLGELANRYCADVVELSDREEVRSVNQTVIYPARISLLSGHSCIAVEVAHASQFSWLYDRHNVPSKIRDLLNDRSWLRSPSNNGGTSAQRYERVQHRDRVSAVRQSRPKAIGQAITSGIGSEDTKPILRELVVLGLTDNIYKTYLHHKKHSIAKMLSYHAPEYRPGSPNLILHQKLEWMLRICRERSVPPNSTAEIRKLAIETNKPVRS